MLLWSRGRSSMSSIRETHKKLACALKKKNASCSGDYGRLCGCSFKVQKGDKIQHILHGKKGVEKRPLNKLLSEGLGLSKDSNYSYLYSRLRDGNGCAARTKEPECLMPSKYHTN